MMYAIVILSLLFTATTLALPRPQCPDCSVPNVFIPTFPWNAPSWMWPHRHIGQGEAQSENQNKERLERDLQPEKDAVVKAADEEPMAGVYYCEDIAWGGACKYLVSRLGSDPMDCTVIDDHASSIGPDPGFYCIFYTNSFCQPIASDGSDTLALTYPGNDNLGFTDKGDFNDKLQSYQCFKQEDSTPSPDIGTPPNSEPTDEAKMG